MLLGSIALNQPTMVKSITDRLKEPQGIPRPSKSMSEMYTFLRKKYVSSASKMAPHELPETLPAEGLMTVPMHTLIPAMTTIPFQFQSNS